MTDWYNLTSIDGSNVLTLVQSINASDMGRGHIGIVMLIVVFIVAFYSFQLFIERTKVNITASFFAVAILSIGFRLINLVNDAVPFVSWGLFALSLAVLILTR